MSKNTHDIPDFEDLGKYQRVLFYFLCRAQLIENVLTTAIKYQNTLMSICVTGFLDLEWKKQDINRSGMGASARLFKSRTSNKALAQKLISLADDRNKVAHSGVLEFVPGFSKTVRTESSEEKIKKLDDLNNRANEALQELTAECKYLHKSIETVRQAKEKAISNLRE